MESVTARTSGVEQTLRLARGVAELMRPGDLVVLVGGLGCGKTAFTQGLGAGLGVTDNITSPTFALVQSYGGRLDLHHLDVYRLDNVNEALDLGLAELLDDDAVVAIEWGDTIAPVLPQEYLEVRIEQVGEGPGGAGAGHAGGDERRFSLVGRGARWQARMRALATVVSNVCGPGAGEPGAGGDEHGHGSGA